MDEELLEAEDSPDAGKLLPHFKALHSSASTLEEVLPPLASAMRETEDALELLAFAEATRESAALERIIEGARHDEASVHQAALELLAFLTTADVDPFGVEATRARLRDAGGFAPVCTLLFSEVALTVALSCGCIQNMLFEDAHAAALAVHTHRRSTRLPSFYTPLMPQPLMPRVPS